ncbi:MAG: CHASE2 domain-containing protein [Desulfococcaceae bacterium]|jgi:adenylate cyclase|nr:CHASE2 domain-containing protein [Desulfococcaceae bacterium]
MMQKKIRFHPLLVSILTVILAISAFLFQIPFLQRMELETVDFRFRFRGEKTPGSSIVLAVVDEKSINELGKWVWPRARFAELLDKLSDAGAKVISFDIGFLEADKSDRSIVKTLEKVRHKMRESGNLLPEMEQYLEKLEEDANQDRILAEAIRKSSAKVVLGYFFHIRLPEAEIPGEEIIAAHKKNIASSEYKIRKQTADDNPEPVMEAIVPQSNIPLISAAAPLSGHFNMEPDQDGVVRFIPAVIRFQESLYAPLSLVTAAAFLDAPSGITTDGSGVVSAMIGDILLPVDSEGRMQINYRGGEKTFPHYSVTDILHDRIPDSVFRNKIVMVGVTAIGVYDMRVIPFDNVFPGLEIHANVVDNILCSDFLQKPDWIFLFDILGIISTGLFLGIILPRLGLAGGTLTVSLLFAAYLSLTQNMFSRQGLVINLVYPSCVMLVMFICTTVYHFFIESRQKKFIRLAFSHFLAPSVVNQIIESPENLDLGGEERYITAFFSDVQGFTSISEMLSPSEIRDILNEFLTEMTDIVLRYEGTVDKFEGDAIIAFFGAPNHIENHALVACKASIDMQKRLAVLREKWKKENKPEMKMRIGMNTGMAVVGNMGSKNRMDYTMIGDTVNTAARLEGMNKVYGIYTLISESTRKEAGAAILCRELDLVGVVGRKEPLRVYEVVDYPENADENLNRLLQYYAQGLSAYRASDWKEAIGCFEKVLEISPEDGPGRTMLQRSREYAENPPEPDWGGIYTAKSK